MTLEFGLGNDIFGMRRTKNKLFLTAFYFYFTDARDRYASLFFYRKVASKRIIKFDFASI